MTRMGIKVTKRGDVSRVPVDQLDYTSQYQSPKMTLPFRGTITTDGSGVGTTGAISHNIGYRPVAFAFYKAPTTDWLAIDNTTVGAETNTNTFVIRVASSYLSSTLQYKAWLMLDPQQERI